MTEKKIEDFFIESGIIDDVFWGVEPDRGILTSFIRLNYNGGSQSFGGYAFDAYDKNLKQRVAGAENEIAQSILLNTFHVPTLNDLVGKKVYAVCNQGEVLAISPINEFNFYSFLSVFKAFDSNQFTVDLINNEKKQYKVFRCSKEEENKLIELKNIFVETAYLDSSISKNINKKEHQLKI